MSVLVTGATGSIGSRVVADLAGAGVGVRAVTRSASRARSMPQGAAPVIVDLEDLAAVDEAIVGVDRVVLITANTPAQARQESNVIEGARRHGVQHLVKLSVGGAAPDAGLALARAHWGAEVRLRGSGVPFTIVRPGFFMQNLLQYAPWIEADGSWRLPLGDRPIAMVHATDVAEVIATTVQGEALATDPFITGGTALTMTDAAALLTEASGRRIDYVDGDPEEYFERMVSAGNGVEYARDMTVLYDQVIRAGYAGALSNDVQRILGREPLTFAQFAGENAAAFRAGGGVRPSHAV